MRRAAALFALCCCLVSVPGWALSPSGWGGTGLWEYPTAEVPGDGRGWFGRARNDPYAPYYFTIGLLPWMEFNVRLTEMRSVVIPTEVWDYFVDKAIDLKFLLYSQDGWIPSFSVGATDISGTKVTDAKYAVATWKLEDFALSMGYGTDRFNGFFGGVSWQILDWLEFKAEYSPMDYTGDMGGGTRILKENPSSKVNYGAVATWNDLSVSLSRQRGDQWCWNFSYAFDVNKPLFGGKKSPVAKPEDGKVIAWEETTPEDMSLNLVEAIGSSIGVRDVNILVGDKKVLIAYENIGYSSQAEALTRVMVMASWLVPWDADTVSFVPRVRGVPVVRVDVPGSQLGLIRLGELNRHDRRSAAIRWATGSRLSVDPDEDWEFFRKPGKTLHKGQNDFKIMLTADLRVDRKTTKPFFMSRWSVDYVYDWRSSQGLAAHLDVRQPISNTIDQWFESEVNDETRIWKGVLSYIHRFGEGLYAVAEVGWLDDMWFGANVWGRWYGKDGSWWLGGRYSFLHERDPYSFAGLSKNQLWISQPTDIPYDGEWWSSWWAQANYTVMPYDLNLTAEYGKFIDGDMGYNLQMTRNWDDLALGLYYRVTDNKIPGENYTKTGAVVSIPADAWWGTDSAQYWKEDMRINSAWIYLGGRMPGSWKTPEDLLGQLRPEVLGINLYNALDDYGRALRGKEGFHDSNLRVYSLYDYVTGYYRVKEDGALLGVK
ncbi:YjbH domain-containing protein [Dethiosulfovibrio salsuginis]|uniref:Exopolysaccharide biosynthesis protein YbjH n=1 Tax=Dethiosulfovibrio salsuginis TaxID=561720 RepID=A0A1X7IPF4_9BACT|nr:YjbH domain-containing protein [Dethiosulfovibrio salsuginis]SMG16641.1 Exopolysaccharide biosynthesis protein YbjH [Dethiosulfovibrio salsuginis]